MKTVAPKLISVSASLTLLLLALGWVHPATTAEDRSNNSPVHIARLSHQADDGPAIITDLHQEYPQSFPILVAMWVNNPGDTPILFPDLASRPHLVRFELRSSSGRHQFRSTTPPEQDKDLTWTIEPRGTRQLIMEIPGSSRLEPGSYQLSIHIQCQGKTYDLPTHDLRITPARPVSADFLADTPLAPEEGWLLPWTYGTGNRVDLALLSVSHPRTDIIDYSYYLASIPRGVSPLLSYSRTREKGNRHVYWMDGSVLYSLRLSGYTVDPRLRRVELPYPSWEPIARGITDSQGSLDLPIWIASPGGNGGEVRVLRVDQKGDTDLRRVVNLDDEPKAVSTVDSAARLRLLLIGEDAADIYTLDPQRDLPASGTRLYTIVEHPPVPAQAEATSTSQDLPRDTPPNDNPPQDGNDSMDQPAASTTEQAVTKMWAQSPSGACFALKPEQRDSSGGLAIFTWTLSRYGNSISAAWYSLEGRLIQEIPVMALPAFSRVHAVFPPGPQGMSLLVETPNDGFQLRSALGQAPLDLEPPGSFDRVRLDPDGIPVMMELSDRQGVTIRHLEQR